jgi:hypothetical protein
MEDIRVHPRVIERHPDLSVEDVRTAWRNAIAYARRDNPEKDFFVAIGADTRARFVEIVATREEDGSLVVFHAMTPPSKRTMEELGMMRR